MGLDDTIGNAAQKLGGQGKSLGTRREMRS